MLGSENVARKNVSIPRQVWPFPVHPGLQTHCRMSPDEGWEQLALASQTTPPHFKSAAREKKERRKNHNREKS